MLDLDYLILGLSLGTVQMTRVWVSFCKVWVQLGQTSELKHNILAKNLRSLRSGEYRRPKGFRPHELSFSSKLNVLKKIGKAIQSISGVFSTFFSVPFLLFIPVVKLSEIV